MQLHEWHFAKCDLMLSVVLKGNIVKEKLPSYRHNSMMFHLLKCQKFGQVYQITDDMEEEGGGMKKLEDQLLNITIAVFLEVTAFVDTDVQCLQQLFHQFYMFGHTEDSTCHNLCHMKIWLTNTQVCNCTDCHHVRSTLCG